jgi:hypothetical protein
MRKPFDDGWIVTTHEWRAQVSGRAATRQRSRAALWSLLCLTLTGSAAAASNVDGAWASNKESCKQLFVQKGKQTHLAPKADLYGSGFVIDGKAIRGKIATCTIKSRQEDGNTVRFDATCATDISLSSNRFELTMVDDNKVMRAFPGVPELDTPYYRCR